MSLFELYTRALQAEYQISDFNAQHSRCRFGLGWIPHAHLLPEKIAHAALSVRFLMPLGIFPWVVIFLPTIFLIQASSVFLKKPWLRARPNLDKCDELFLGTSTVETLKSIERNFDLPRAYLHVPWREVPEGLPESLTKFNLVEIVTFLDILRALILAWVMTVNLCFRISTWKLLIYGYMGFNWTLVYYALTSHTIREIWISNHYDRWALMIDGLDQVKKTMVQHGQLEMPSLLNDRTVTFGPRPKLFSDWSLYFFSANGLQQFSEYVLANKPKRYFHFELEYALVGVDDDCPSVLVIGSPAIWREQARELVKLFDQFGPQISYYYRPHPRGGTPKIETKLTAIGAKVIVNRLPRVSAVITYPSTINVSLEEMDFAPLFEFNFRKQDGLEETRQKLYQYIGRILEEECAE